MDELRRIDLNSLLTLHALLTEKHVTRAALRLHKSQPAVSHALSQLRERFDDPLLVRRQGRMELTARAQQIIEPLDDALGNLNALLATPMFDPALARNRFRLALSDYASHLLLPGLTRHVRSVAPGVDLGVSQGSREAMLAQLLDGEIDLALGIFPERPPEIQVEDLFGEGFVCVADSVTLPPSRNLSFDDWLSRPHVMLALRPDAVDEIDRTLAAKGIKRHIAVALPHWSVAPKLIAGTDLILTIASHALRTMPDMDALHAFRPPLALPRFSYQQAWHVRRDTDPAHRWLRSVILECGARYKTNPYQDLLA
ncbi:LysR family transcriptional regulator [Burkholderia sp. Bp9140]|uniref:LysR family transcriptional regulator n=1 Tax=Burkholderia sp. Bp9140 TaxID=2184572 RepID=UPI000F58F20A|nr:LysR family transcriptional regulator [Burkholderia sp. Bp9140]RQR54579.1 LysR family transcriptional regulator [Burkholderia sp. Bp9140]